MRFPTQVPAAMALMATALGSGVRAEPLVVLTYNAWHGTFRTQEEEILEFPSESARHRELRFRHQVSQLAALRPDVILLQEVNPLPQRLRRLAAALGYDAWHKTTDCGVKLFGLGLPSNINSGLAILARPPLRLTPIGVERLSGRWAFCSDWLGLQFEEARYALLVGLTLENGDRYLVVNTHLHNAPEMPDGLRQGIGELHAAGALSPAQVEEIHRAVEGGQARKRQEVERLISAVQWALRQHRELAGVILGGDLNAAPDSDHLIRLRRAGLVDAARAVEPRSGLATYDPQRNPLVPVLNRVAKPEIPTFGKPALVELARRTRLLEPQQIDYLLVSESLERAVAGVKLFGLEEVELPPGHDQGAGFFLPLIGSDHFGLAVELDLQRP